MRASCVDCASTSGDNLGQFCAWCNATQLCHSVTNATVNCTYEQYNQTCDNQLQLNIGGVSENMVSNEQASSTGAIASGIGGALVLGGALAGGLFMAKRKPSIPNFMSEMGGEVNVNPLYEGNVASFENPLYQGNQTADPGSGGQFADRMADVADD